MDNNPWSLLHIVIPLYQCGLWKIYTIRLFRRKASVLFYTSMPVVSVPVYLLSKVVPRLMKAYMYTVIWVLL